MLPHTPTTHRLPASVFDLFVLRIFVFRFFFLLLQEESCVSGGSMLPHTPTTQRLPASVFLFSFPPNFPAFHSCFLFRLQEELCLRWILELPYARLKEVLAELRWLHPQSLEDLPESEANELMSR